MNDATVVSLAQDALMTAFLVAAPILVVSLVIGMVVSVLQAMTQINEITLTFVPKIFGVFLGAAVLGPWRVSTMVDYTTRLFSALPAVAHQAPPSCQPRAPAGRRRRQAPRSARPGAHMRWVVAASLARAWASLRARSENEVAAPSLPESASASGGSG